MMRKLQFETTHATFDRVEFQFIHLEDLVRFELLQFNHYTCLNISILSAKNDFPAKTI